jgi:hypothetical protein
VLEVKDDADAGEGLPLLLPASTEGPDSVAVVSIRWW